MPVNEVKPESRDGRTLKEEATGTIDEDIPSFTPDHFMSLQDILKIVMELFQS